MHFHLGSAKTANDKYEKARVWNEDCKKVPGCSKKCQDDECYLCIAPSITAFWLHVNIFLSRLTRASYPYKDMGWKAAWNIICPPIMPQRVYHMEWLASLKLLLTTTRSHSSHLSLSDLTSLDKKNLFVILTMNANAKSYLNETNVWDGWNPHPGRSSQFQTITWAYGSPWFWKLPHIATHIYGKLCLEVILGK